MPDQTPTTPSNQQKLNPWEANDPSRVDRPVPEPPQLSSKILWLVACIVLVAFAVHALLVYVGLPEQIPTHFGPSGDPDGWGSKPTFIMMIVIEVLCSGSILLLSRYPRIFNVPKAPTTNAGWQLLYTAGRNLMLVISLCCSALFATITLSTQTAVAGRPTSSVATIFILVVMIAFVAYSSSKMLRIANDH